MIRIERDEVNGFLRGPNEQTQRYSASGVFVASNSRSTFVDERKEKTVRNRLISIAQAENALRQFRKDQPLNNTGVMQMNPAALSMMMTQLVLNVFGSNAQCLCLQLDRATEVQRILLDKKVAEYQEQIQKAVEQLDKARNANIINALFDWIISGIEAVIGLMKMAEGLLMANPLDCVDGAAWFSAGLSAMVKAAAETALLMGADKDTSQAIIEGAGTAQLSCEGVAMALDILQIGRGLIAAKALVCATGKALDSGIGERLLKSMANMAEGIAENEMRAVYDELGATVGKQLEQNFGMTAEREMVDASNMAIEASARSVKAEAQMIRSMGKNFTRAGVEAMVKEAAQAGVKTLLKEGAELTQEKLRKTIISKLRRQIMCALLADNVNTTLQIVRATTKGCELIATGIIEATAAATRKQIEQLIVQQAFIDFMEDWSEEQKKAQQARLQEAWQGGSAAMESALEMIDEYGTVLASMAVGRA
ncbi:type III secretion system translocon subunit SctE [Kosakonia sp. BYX6]|uniref:Type III secretion system translocon subunit SctE n=1 Tax=Kosakonia calanthes TaxID=3139408 RepID=A0ABZ3B4M0_9ENTR